MPVTRNSEHPPKSGIPGSDFPQHLRSRFPKVQDNGSFQSAMEPVTELLNPHPLGPDGEMPALIRRDQQPLSKPEVLYPEMSYRENEHEPWSNEAIAKATQLYPDLPQKIVASQQMVQDTPEDVLDKDYFRLPDNPTLSDQYRHATWRKKKYGTI
jgi:hypothetical protein